MVKTIGNPLTWAFGAIGTAGGHVGAAVGELRHAPDAAPPVARTLTLADLRQSLRLGLADFAALRSDVIFLCVLYPIIGAVLLWSAANAALWPILFPLVSGFALIGPLAAVGLYEMSRRRERGLPARWADGFHFLSTPALGPVTLMGLYLTGLFVVWMGVALALWQMTLGGTVYATLGVFLSAVFGTAAGWTLIVLGCGLGFVFAAVALAISVVSFPLIIDRHVQVPQAVVASVAVARKNPVTVAVWGLFVAALLVLGSLPFLLGLVVVLPVLGHASWHLYRRAIG